MTGENGRGFHFGLEAEYLLVDADSFQPLWHRDLSFAELNAALEAIPVDDLPPLEGLEPDPPHRTVMPYLVEGYQVPDPDLTPVDVLPKGVEIRTPVCSSVMRCLACFQELHERMQAALAGLGYRAVALSHHPTEHQFAGPQNAQRHDFWQWAMQAMTTYGPDVNVSVPVTLGWLQRVEELHAKVNYYAPALVALGLASPLYRGGLWEIRGRIGKSVRTYRRSVIAPAIMLHPKEAGRLEFKAFEMTCRLNDFHAYFLLWLELLLDDGLRGRATHQDRIYDLGAVARDGLAAEAVADRAAEVLERAPGVLTGRGFDPRPLESFRRRLDSGRLPADDLVDLYERERSIPAVLRQLATLQPAGVTEAGRFARIPVRGRASLPTTSLPEEKLACE
ncbi:MAG: glutamate-cysteine ligase family protein [Planctomycetaceae bacterium]